MRGVIKIPLRVLASLLLAAGTPLLRAESNLVVIANADSGVSQLTQDEARNVFLGRQKRLASGLPALPVEQGAPADVRARFYRLLAHKDLADINAYWARLCFTGQARPPRQAASAEQVIRIVAAEKGAIGLLEWDKADRRVRVVLALNDPSGP
jgi:ABC-type phosphate transport system substrate-binding protein